MEGREERKEGRKGKKEKRKGGREGGEEEGKKRRKEGKKERKEPRSKLTSCLVPGYIGCFVDKYQNRDLTKSFMVSGLTPASCRAVCKEKGHAYAGMQYGYLCHCGDGYGKYGHAAEKECNSVCLGDDEKKCGGFWRNSIYVAG